MPLYEYECKKCHHRFERIQKFSDPHVKKCPECGGPIEQVISAPAVQFKGSGWYVTDYAKKSSDRFLFIVFQRRFVLQEGRFEIEESAPKVRKLFQVGSEKKARRNRKTPPKKSDAGRASARARLNAISGYIPAPPESGSRTHTPARR